MNGAADYAPELAARFRTFMEKMNSVFLLATARTMSFRLYGKQEVQDNPFFLLEFSGDGFLRFAHHATKEHPQLMLGGCNGEVWAGSTEITNLLGARKKVENLDKLDMEFDLDLPWDRALRFYSLDGCIIQCESYRKLNMSIVTKTKD